MLQAKLDFTMHMYLCICKQSWQ